jgi:hypothetical protein
MQEDFEQESAEIGLFTTLSSPLVKFILFAQL